MKDLSVLLDESELYLSDVDLAYLKSFLHEDDFKGYSIKDRTVVEGLFFINRVGANNLIHNKICPKEEQLCRALWRSYEQIKQLPFSDLIKRIRRHHGQ